MKTVYIIIFVFIAALNVGFPIAVTWTESSPKRSIANSIDNFSKPYRIVVKENHAQFVFENPLFNFEVSIVSESEVQNLFQYLAAQKHIPFKYLEGGCHARAHEMALLLEKKNILVGKAFLLGDLRINVETDNIKRIIEWPEHVAPFVLVQKDQVLKKYVLDPSIFNFAVEFEDWIQIQTLHQPNPPVRIYYTPRFYYESYSFAFITDKFEDYDIESMKLKLEKYLESQR